LVSDDQVPADPQEQREQIAALARGPKGERGKAGQRGAPGMPAGQRRAIIFLFFLTVALSVAAFLAAVQRGDATQAASHHAGEVLEHKLCMTFGRLAALTPPPGNPETNPSRGYEQGEHAVLDQIGPDL